MATSYQIPGRSFIQQTVGGQFQIPGRDFVMASAGTWKTTLGVTTSSQMKTVLGLALGSIKTSDGLTPR
jgi:hypothetical protein